MTASSPGPRRPPICRVASPRRTPCPKQTTHRPPRRCERGLARAVAREPCAQHAGDGAVGIGDGGEQRRPGLARCTLVGAVEAAWDGSAAPADRARPRCRGCAGRWPQACPGIGLAEANRRRAASGDPLGTGGRAGPEPWYSRSGRLRNRRASSSTSRKASSRQVRAIRSSRSPCSPSRNRPSARQRPCRCPARSAAP